jgi:flavin reductase (DIM6/NTAB) family NADH-FMN oxidoreductase RutF
MFDFLTGFVSFCRGDDKMKTESAGRAFHTYRPNEGHRLAHNPLNSIVGPRPIGWISTISANGIMNLAPFSFFNMFSYDPPILGFSPADSSDTLENVRATGEFAWNLVTRDLAEAMNATSARVSPDVDEFSLGGVKAIPSVEISAPRVAESPVHIECKVTEIIPVRGYGGTVGTHSLVLGEMVHIHIDKDYIFDGIYMTSMPIPILCGGGRTDYYSILDENCFSIQRPA